MPSGFTNIMIYKDIFMVKFCANQAKPLWAGISGGISGRLLTKLSTEFVGKNFPLPIHQLKH
jgi:hypothetical protein